ncbi:diacylglycerol/lipid kinase family protein [Limosilactobacillus caecicola]|uniref:diacylglycerol/lipid kinase family protein n=1 Tax=Limosilactobacillus caecicola TaxID=2941332 RepID=UPI00203EBC34|nr:diacylglycerol kinase family protein [Limosilactobacillus caecicola]
MHYELIINPAAGSGTGKQIGNIITNYLTEHHISFNAQASQAAGQPRELAHRLAQNHPATTCVIVVGGDGTLHEVITGLLLTSQEQPLPVAYIPAGTGNDFARGYGIANQPLAALQQILNNDHPTFINVGHFHDGQQEGIFLNNFGTGFDAAIVHRTNTSRIKRLLNHLHLGTLSYVANTLSVLIHQRPFEVTITDDQQHKFTHAFLVVTSNHPFIGGGIKIAPDQEVTKEEVELVVLEKHDPLTLLGSIIMFALGYVTSSRFAHVFRATHLHYQVRPAQYGQIDGEELGKKTYDLQIDCRSYPMWEQRL